MQLHISSSMPRACAYYVAYSAALLVLLHGLPAMHSQAGAYSWQVKFQGLSSKLVKHAGTENLKHKCGAMLVA